MDWDKEIRFLKKLLKQYKSEFDRLVRNGKTYEYENINEYHRKVFERELIIQNIESRIELCKNRRLL
ncbi:MAG TPA: hypothetical protein DGK91_05015 [Clostridium sp.]|nr:hypothetical protein [Bacillota bacterium]NLP28199.1 hypothetical protein [Clostridia bacterium]HCW03946.1 hypothetical protein [Clostridium sp.]